MDTRLRKYLRMARAAGLFALGLTSLSVRADLADDLARIAVEQSGGPRAHAALTGFRATGVTKVGAKEAPFILYAARPRSVRIETMGEKTSLVRAFDGIHAPWKKEDFLAPPVRLTVAEERDFILDADFDSPLHDYRARRISLEYAGTETIDGRLYHKLLATFRLAETATLYLDAETHLLVRRDTIKIVRGRTFVVETHYGGFKSVGGVMLPSSIRTQVGARVLHETVIQAYSANPKLPADFFAPPIDEWPKL